MSRRWSSRRRIFVSLVLLVLLIVPALDAGPAVAAPKRVTQVTVKNFGSRVVIGIVSTGQILFHMSEISTPPPPRVAIDLLDTVVDEDLRVTTEVNKGTIVRVRVGQFQESPAIARVVIDLARPVPVDVTRTAANILAVSVPMQPVTEAQAKAAAAAPVPVKPGTARAPVPPAAQAAPAGVPAVSAAPGTGLARTAQVPGAGQGPGVIKLLEFRDVQLTAVLTALAKLCGFNLVTDATVQGTITLRLVDVTCEDALRFILEANNLAFRRFGRNLIVADAKKLEPPGEIPETIVYRLAFGDVNKIRAAIAAAVPGVRVAVDDRTNTLLITGTSAQHEEVRRVLQTLDVRIPQVVIQVHVIEVNRRAVRDLGLLSGVGGSNFGSVVLDSANNRISFALLSVDLILFRLQALITENAGRVLAAPRIATLDGNKASILLGDQFPIISSVPSAGTITQTVSFVPIGVKLDVTPRVNVDGLITIQLKPEVSSVVEIITTTQGTRAPRIATRNADTTLTVRDGQTIVVGGLINQEERKQTIKVPLLGDIPILGELFRFTNTDVRDTEVIFLITPSIMKDTSP